MPCCPCCFTNNLPIKNIVSFLKPAYRSIRVHKTAFSKSFGKYICLISKYGYKKILPHWIGNHFHRASYMFSFSAWHSFFFKKFFFICSKSHTAYFSNVWISKFWQRKFLAHYWLVGSIFNTFNDFNIILNQKCLSFSRIHHFHKIFSWSGKKKK